MAPTSTRIQLKAGEGGRIQMLGVSPGTAKTASELLQHNHESHHAFFNIETGFHNHILHDMLTQYDLGASAAVLNETYEREKSYQLALPPVDENVLSDLKDETNWGKYLGEREHYTNFLKFFENEIDALGYEETINKRLFARTDLAENMLVRTFGGLLHPFIHLGFGVEFRQPAIVAEALAQAAVHDTSFETILLGAEKEVAAAKETDVKLSTLIEDIRNNSKVEAATAGINDARSLGMAFEKVSKEVIQYAKRFQVPIDQIEYKTAEAINIAAGFCAAAVRKDKQVKFDFFYMHSHNDSVMLTTFVQQDWITPENKARLVEWKARGDLVVYGALGSAPLLLDEVKSYVPKQNNFSNPWTNIIERGLSIKDDGHCIKFIRACANGERFSRKYDGADGFLMQGDMWQQMAMMCIDSCEEPGPQWIRGAGFDAAWKDVGPRKGYVQMEVR